MDFPLHLPDVPWFVMAAVPLVVFAAYTVFGATGFGSSVIGVPLLAHAFPLTFAVPLITALDAFGATATSIRRWRHADRGEIARIVPTMMIGIALGATVLVNLPRRPALLALGVFVTLYGAWALIGPRGMRRAPGWLAIPIGLVGGVFSVLFGTGGPIYMVYLSARIEDKGALRATSAAIITVSVWMRIAVFLVTGILLDPPLLAAALVCLPLMALGLRVGNRLHDALSRGGVMRLIALLLVGNGILLVARAL